MGVQKIGVFFQEFCGGFVASFAEKTSSADQGGDVRCQRGRRISAGFLPALLLSDRAMLDKIGRRMRNHRVGVKILQGFLAMELPSEKNRKRHFVKLDSLPVGPAIHPEILREAAILLLCDGQIDERAKRRGGITSRKHGGGAVDQVACPNQVVSAVLLVAFGFSPRDRERGDERPRKGFVFVSAEQAETARSEERRVG